MDIFGNFRYGDIILWCMTSFWIYAC